jgi:hypothetical protein
MKIYPSISVDPEEFRRAAMNGEGTLFFQKFNLGAPLVFGPSMASYVFLEAKRVLEECRNVDLKSYREIHKGGPYYWMGIAAYLFNDFQTATYYFDSAVSEDLRNKNRAKDETTPAMCFMLLHGDQPAQAAQSLVKDVEARIEELVEKYNKRAKLLPVGINSISLETIRKKFLRPALLKKHSSYRSMATVLISFCREWDHKNSFFDLQPRRGSFEPFFIHLFKGCVLFESLLRNSPTLLNKHINPDNVKTLGSLLEELKTDLQIKNINIKEFNFDQILEDIVSDNGSIETAINLTGKIRNTLGHNIGRKSDLSKTKYSKLFRIITASCFHAINALY